MLSNDFKYLHRLKQTWVRRLGCAADVQLTAVLQLRLKVGVYLGDISDAFDRVNATRLLHKLRRLGVTTTQIFF